MPSTPLWTCPKCSRPFAIRNQPHYCANFTVVEHQKNKSPLSINLYKKYESLVKKCGPIIIAPTKTRIGFQVRMIFSAVTLKKNRLDAHVVLSRRLEHPRFTRIESFSPRNHVHYFRIHTLEELDDEVEEWLQEAYHVGEQKHLMK